MKAMGLLFIILFIGFVSCKSKFDQFVPHQESQRNAMKELTFDTIEISQELKLSAMGFEETISNSPDTVEFFKPEMGIKVEKLEKAIQSKSNPDFVYSNSNYTFRSANHDFDWMCHFDVEHNQLYCRNRNFQKIDNSYLADNLKIRTQDGGLSMASGTCPKLQKFPLSQYLDEITFAKDFNNFSGEIILKDIPSSDGKPCRYVYSVKLIER